MDDLGRTGRNLAKCMDMSHNIMSPNLFLDSGDLKVLVSHHQMLLHLLERLIADLLNSKLFLCLSQVEPQLAPRRVSRTLAEKLRHFRRAVSSCERGLIRVKDGGAILGLHLADLALQVERGVFYGCHCVVCICVWESIDLKWAMRLYLKIQVKMVSEGYTTENRNGRCRFLFYPSQSSLLSRGGPKF